MKKIGTKRAVYAKRAKQTSGGLTASDLKKNRHGRVVSKRKSAWALSAKNPLRDYLQSKNGKPKAKNGGRPKAKNGKGKNGGKAKASKIVKRPKRDRKKPAYYGIDFT